MYKFISMLLVHSNRTTRVLRKKNKYPSTFSMPNNLFLLQFHILKSVNECMFLNERFI